MTRKEIIGLILILWAPVLGIILCIAMLIATIGWPVVVIISIVVSIVIGASLL